MQITVWGSDECISRVLVSQVEEVSGIVVNRWDDVYYGDTAVIDATYIDGCYIKFEPVPAEGCRFTRWAYRIYENNPDEAVKYTAINPYTYYGEDNIYIRAEGEFFGEEETWTLDRLNYGTVKYDKPETISLQPYTLYRREMTFSGNGRAAIQTEGSVDTIGWISTSQNWSDGVPINWLYEDDDSGMNGNFYIELDVKSDTTYYVWLRCNDPSISGTTTLKINAPNIPAKWDWDVSTYLMASDEEMKAAHNAIVDKTSTTNFSFVVWEELCLKVKDILSYKGRSWDTYYAAFINTKMKYNDKELTAVRFNSLRNNLDFAYDTEIDKVESGDDVLGSYFITLAKCINDCIDNL